MIVPSLRTARIAALVSGLTALVATLTGTASWTLFGVCYVAWCYSGWVLYFAGRASSGKLRMLELLMAATGLIAAFGIAAHVYLLALGPAWIL
jgi:hypothetical protein